MLVPLILSSATTAVASLASTSKGSGLATKSLIIFFSMTFVTSVIGTSVSLIFKPGLHTAIDMSAINMNSGVVSNVMSSVNTSEKLTIARFIFDMIPNNIFTAMEKNNFLQVVFFSMVLGLSLAKSKTRKCRICCKRNCRSGRNINVSGKNDYVICCTFLEYLESLLGLFLRKVLNYFLLF